MDKYESLKATSELKNAFLTILSHQFNLIRIDTNLIPSHNTENFIEILRKYEFPIYSGFIIEELINENNNKIHIFEEINEDKYCYESLTKIIEKILFSIKSANDFIEMLYLDLKTKLDKEVNRYTFEKSYENTLKNSNQNDKMKVITNITSLESKIFIKNIFNNEYFEIITVSLNKIKNNFYCLIDINMSMFVNYLIEKE